MIDVSYGVIPLTLKDNQWLFFLVQHKNGLHWGFPKGHAENNETPKQSALRELKEEADLDPVNDLSISLEEKYTFEKKGETFNKQVHYFLMETTTEYKLDPVETVDGGWFTYAHAKEKITFSESQRLLEKAYQEIKKTES